MPRLAGAYEEADQWRSSITDPKACIVCWSRDAQPDRKIYLNGSGLLLECCLSNNRMRPRQHLSIHCAIEDQSLTSADSKMISELLSCIFSCFNDDDNTNVVDNGQGYDANNYGYAGDSGGQVQYEQQQDFQSYNQASQPQDFQSYNQAPPPQDFQSYGQAQPGMTNAQMGMAVQASQAYHAPLLGLSSLPIGQG